MDKRVDNLINNADLPTDQQLDPQEEFKDLRLDGYPPGTVIKAFEPDPSFTPGKVDHPLINQNEPFADTPDTPSTTEEESSRFYDEQNKKVDSFWKNKLGN